MGESQADRPCAGPLEALPLWGAFYPWPWRHGEQGWAWVAAQQADSMAQRVLGFVVLAAGVGAVSGGMSFLMAHAATKALLFLAAGIWLTALGTKQLSALRGVARR